MKPNQVQLTTLLDHYRNGRINDAEKLASQITQKFPQHLFAWKVLGAIFGQTGRHFEAAHAFQKAVNLSPKDAEAHFNLGITFQALKKFNKAEASYNQAIILKPDYAKAYCNLGIIHFDSGRLDKSQASYIKAIDLNPNFAEAHNNLGNVLKELGKLNEAQNSYQTAIALKPDYAEAYNNLGNLMRDRGNLVEACSAHIEAININPNSADGYVSLSLTIKNMRFNSPNRKLYSPLIQLLTTGNFIHPKVMAPSILSLIKQDPLMKDLLCEKGMFKNIKDATSAVENLFELKLLHHLLRVCPIPDLQFEEFFENMRRFILENLYVIKSSDQLIYFLSTLSLHCFTNEYVYFEADEETHLIENLEEKITQAVSNLETPEAKDILCLASYRPLHQYNWCKQIKTLDHLEELKKRLIDEPQLEILIAKKVPLLGDISNKVSNKVRTQYEENPYPRWVQLALHIKTKSISEVCHQLNLKLHSENIKNVKSPSILIAGCGTGQHSIRTASRFSHCHVTAVDLSLASLAYAKRKSKELGFSNINYLQADILHLDQINKEFDIIESAGVLHHMDKPIAGWKVLKNLLKTGGLMKIGLYSELARNRVIKIRDEITSLGIGASASEIKNFRHLVNISKENDKKKISDFSDFFSLSECRDLIFHVQEHNFTLPMIQECLNDLELKFCGFEDQDIVSKFKKFHGKGSDTYDLMLWHQFEKNNPDTFGNMYQFWCQKI